MKKRKRRTGNSPSAPAGARGLVWAGLASRAWQGGLTAVVIACGLALLPPGATAKKKKPPTKTVTGEVMDQTRNPIVGATVELTNVRTDKKLAIYSEAGGRYSFAGLAPADDYQVQAHYKEQSSEVRKASSLDDREIIVLNLQIPPSPGQ